MDARFQECMLKVKNSYIFCKIRINPQAPSTFLLMLPDLPGYDHQSSLPLLERLTTEAAKTQQTLPSIILFDFPGCGRSDKAKNPRDEYTIDNFAEVTAFVIEHIRLKVCPPSLVLNLKIYGESFGSLIAMSLVPRRPKWMNFGNNIRLTQIISNGGICGMIDKEYALNYIFQHFFHHEPYESLHNALTKLFNGDIKDLEDYISEIAIPLAPLFSQTYIGLPNSTLGTILRERPTLGAPILRAIRYVGHFIGKDVKAIDDNLHHFTGVSADVMQRFFATRFNGVNVLQMVTDNPAPYAGVNVLMLAGREDCFVNFVTVLAIRNQLQANGSVIILNDRHLTLCTPGQNAVDKVILKSISKRLTNEDAVDSIFNYSHFPERIPKVKTTRAKLFKCSTRMINAATGEVIQQSTADVFIEGNESANNNNTEPHNQPRPQQQTISTGAYQPITGNPEDIVIKKKRA